MVGIAVLQFYISSLCKSKFTKSLPQGQLWQVVDAEENESR